MFTIKKILVKIYSKIYVYADRIYVCVENKYMNYKYKFLYILETGLLTRFNSDENYPSCNYK